MDNVMITLALLSELFNECNAEFFKNELPTPDFRVSTGRRALGSCSVRRATTVRIGGMKFANKLKEPKLTIAISNYYKVSRDEVKNTMIHEMIHLWQWVTYQDMNHLTTFKEKAREVERISNGKFTITRLANRKNYEEANPKSPTNYKNKLYAVFAQRNSLGGTTRAWIVACTQAMAREYKTGFTMRNNWNLELVGFVRERFEPDFDRLPKMHTCLRIKGKTMLWERLNNEYSEFANCISA